MRAGKRDVCSVLIALAGLAASACGGGSGGPGGSAASDGAVLLPVPSDPTVTFKVWFDVGSSDDPDGKEGLAALTGTMIAEGATTENAYEDILEKLYPMAASYSVRVDKEMTVLTGRTHRDNIDAFFELFTDAFTKPAFAPADFERHRKNAVNAIETTLRYNSDEELGKAAFFATVFEGTGYAHPPVGTVSGLRSITLDDVRAFFETNYTRAKATIALGGGYEPAHVQALSDALDRLPPGGSAPDATPIAAPEIEGRRVVLVEKPDADASISFGFPIDVRRGERDFYALWIATSWLGEHRNSSSHLYQVIREARGMNYGDYAYIEAFPEGGARSMPPTHVAREVQAFEVWIRTLPNEQAAFALRAALREVEALVEEGMSEAEFELTRSFLSKYVLHFAKTTTARLGYAVDDRFYGIEPPGHLETFRTMMASITRDEVNAALREHFTPDDLVIAMVTGEPESLKRDLTSGQPTPITYPTPKDDAIVEEDAIIAAYPLRIEPDEVRILPVEAIFE